jgi:hypothetical protein
LLHLTAALPLAALFLRAGLGSPQVATAYVMTLVLGTGSLFIAGHYYKIIPFLVWLHRFGPLAGKRPVPRFAELFDARVATAAGGLLALGSAGMIAATLAGAGRLARLGAAAYACGAVIAAIQMVALLRRRP